MYTLSLHDALPISQLDRGGVEEAVLDEAELLGRRSAEPRRQADPVVRRHVLLGVHDDVPFGIEAALHRDLEQPVTDHAVTDDDQRLAHQALLLVGTSSGAMRSSSAA